MGRDNKRSSTCHYDRAKTASSVVFNPTDNNKQVPDR
jgi:hypothetical protein